MKILLKSLFLRMISKTWNWKLFSFLIAFSSVITSSNGFNDNMKENLMKLAAANNDLGLKLYNRLVKETSGNVFFSPFSISIAFGMLFAGAEGNSAKQLRSVLGYDAANLPNSQVSSTFNQYLNKVMSKNQSKDPDYALNLANELLLSEDFNVNPNYKKEVQNLFDAHIKEVDFMKNTDQVLNEVNYFVSKQTHGKIDKLLSDLDPSTVLIILNAVYFYGNWKSPFDKIMTMTRTFYNHGSNSITKEVPFMHQTEAFPYVSINDVQVLELPYKGDNVSMIVLLPDQLDGLASLESSITPEKIMNILKQMKRMKVNVKFPKFKIDYERKLNPAFKALGAIDIFRPGLADLSGITPNNNIYVSDVIHKAAIEVNEKGSEAAAATAIKIVPMSLLITPRPPPVFTVDHPFMFAIIDKRNDLMLFLGRVTEL